MRDLKGNTYLLRALQKYLLICDHDKAGGIAFAEIDIFLKDLKPVQLSRPAARHRGLVYVSRVPHHLCRHGGVFEVHLFPVMEA